MKPWICALFLLLPAPAWACYAYVPMQVRLLSAELVVVGKIEKVEQKGDREIGTIRVRKVLLGNPNTTMARLSWPKPPPPGGPRLADGPMRYRNGMDGVWILNRDSRLEPHTAGYPGDFMTLERARQVVKDIKAARDTVWSPVQNGLQLALVYELRDQRKAKVMHLGKPIDALAQVSIYPVLRNASEAALEVCDFFGDKPVRITATGPGGQEEEIALYPARAQQPKPNKWAFSRLGPGGTRQLGYGFTLPPVTTPGVWQYQFQYANQRAGDEFGFEQVWKGTLKASPISVPVAGKEGLK